MTCLEIKYALKKAAQMLGDAGIEVPALEAGMLLCSVLNCDRIFLYSHSDDVIKKDIEDRFFDGVQLRCKGRPIQYIIGHQEFMSLDFKVAPGVLIPRQDTEILVETVLNYTKGLEGESLRGLKILDIGTGSGCIAISLAHYIKEAIVTAVDFSEEALKIAMQNAIMNKVEGRIAFQKSDLFSGIPKDNFFDIIVSNPPYIPSFEIRQLKAEVKEYEPNCALDGGEDGLDFYRKISTSACEYQKPGALLAFEVGMGQARDVKEIMKDKYSEIIISNDLSGIERVVAGRRK